MSLKTIKFITSRLNKGIESLQLPFFALSFYSVFRGRLQTNGYVCFNRMKVKTINSKESAKAKLGRCGVYKKRKGEVEKREAVGINNCDSCVDMAS